MTDKITVPRETWDAMREALEHIQRCIGFDKATIHQGSATWCEIDDALTAANAVQPQAKIIGTIAHIGNGKSTLTSALATVLKKVHQPQAPYPNCRFKICDLPGQCKGEGKCHHPAVAQAQGKAIHQVYMGDGWKDKPASEMWMYTPEQGWESKYVRTVYTHPQATEPAPSTYEPIGWADWQGNMVTAFRQWSDGSSEEIVVYRKLSAAPEQKS